MSTGPVTVTITMQFHARRSWMMRARVRLYAAAVALGVMTEDEAMQRAVKATARHIARDLKRITSQSAGRWIHHPLRTTERDRKWMGFGR